MDPVKKYVEGWRFSDDCQGLIRSELELWRKQYLPGDEQVNDGEET